MFMSLISGEPGLKTDLLHNYHIDGFKSLFGTKIMAIFFVASVPDGGRVSSGQMNFFLNTLYWNN